MQINTSPVLNLSTEFENEFFEILAKMIISLKMRKFLQKYLTFENNRYCLNLSFNNHSEVLHDNFNVARSRLISLKRKFNSNPKLLHEYD